LRFIVPQRLKYNSLFYYILCALLQLNAGKHKNNKGGFSSVVLKEAILGALTAQAPGQLDVLWKHRGPAGVNRT